MAGITPIAQPLLAQDESDEQPKMSRGTTSKEQDQARVYPVRSHASATHQTQGVESGLYTVLELYDNISLRTDRWNLCLKNIDHEFYFRDVDGIWRPLSDFVSVIGEKYGRLADDTWSEYLTIAQSSYMADTCGHDKTFGC